MKTGSVPAKKKPKNKTAKPIETEDGYVSCGNVFRDLGLPNPELLLMKSELVRRLGNAIAARGLSQNQAADILGLDQPKVSHLLRGHTQGYSLDRLMLLLVRIGQDVSIEVKPAKGTTGVLKVGGHVVH